MKKYLLFFMGCFFCTSFVHAGGYETGTSCVNVDSLAPLKIPTDDTKGLNSRFSSPTGVQGLMHSLSPREGVHHACQTPNIDQPTSPSREKDRLRAYSTDSTVFQHVVSCNPRRIFFTRSLSSHTDKSLCACQTPSLEPDSSSRENDRLRAFSTDSQDFMVGAGCDIDHSPRTLQIDPRMLTSVVLARCASESTIRTTPVCSGLGVRCLTDTREALSSGQYLAPSKLSRCPTEDLK